MNIIIETIVKNEEYILNEWIIHHLLIGFNHIYIYDDASIIPVEEIIIKLPDIYKKKITVYRIEDEFYTDKFINSKYYNEKLYNKYKKLKQLYIMNYFLKNHKNIAKWCLFSDCDEFICLNNNNNINEFLDDKDKYDIIYIKWLNYGTSFYIDEPNGLVMNNFIYHGLNYSHLGKSILKLQDIDINNIHTLNNNLNTLNINGTLYNSQIHINHYITTYLKRYIRRKLNKNIGQIDGKLRNPIEYFTLIFESNYINSKLNFKYFSKINEYINNINKILKKTLNDNIIYKSNVLKINDSTILHHIKNNNFEFLYDVKPTIELFKSILTANVKYCSYYEIIKNIDINDLNERYSYFNNNNNILNYYLHFSYNKNEKVKKNNMCLQLFRKTK